MDNFLGRLIVVVIMVPLGMHGIGYGMEENGGAHRSNPVWRLFQDYFDFEAGVIKLLLIAGALVFGAWAIMTYTSHWWDQKVEEEKTQIEEEKRLAAIQREEAYEKRLAERILREEQIEQEKRDLAQTIKSQRSDSESTAQPAIDGTQLKTITPDELKRRAIEQFKKGN